jgi:two-component system nitrate/nitrite sensor histidine kinase NarX
MSAVVLLAVVSMVSSVFIAQTTEGMATAINQAGSLRMQAYRIGVALADESVPAPSRAARAVALAAEFEERLSSPRLMNAVAGRVDRRVVRAYGAVHSLWEQRMKHPLAEDVRLLRTGATEASRLPARADYLAGVDAFVGEIDVFVRLLEDLAERRIDFLRSTQAVSLALTVLIVTATMVLMLRRVIRPLDDLLQCADRVRVGDFGGRAGATGGDELGRLGLAMNLMSAGLSDLYGDLERRVAEKTQDLERSNHSLDLLYRVSKTLNEAPVSEGLLRETLREMSREIKVGPGTLCLRDADSGSPGAVLVTTRAEGEAGGPCREAGCQACEDLLHAQTLTLALPDGGRRRVLCCPVADQAQRYGVLLVDLPDGIELESWQRRLISTLAGHIGTALSLQQRMRESRRLVLHEERGIIARELHDSLAQSLSYLKIQATRLAAALGDPHDISAPLAVLEEMREGINSACRQLRELLTTFRLKMDDRGLGRALEATVEEFRGRGAVGIALDNRLPSALLTANEEIHVLQIVREALSNVIRHANARRAIVSLRQSGGVLEVAIEDDGCGIGPEQARAAHYGMTIMRERAASLDGSLEVTVTAGGGTRVHLRFRHRSATPAESAATVMGALA